MILTGLILDCCCACKRAHRVEEKKKNNPDKIIQGSCAENTRKKQLIPRDKIWISASSDYALASKGNSDLIPDFIPQTNHWAEFVFFRWPCS